MRLISYLNGPMDFSCKTFRNLYFIPPSIFIIEKDIVNIHQELMEDVPDSWERDQVPQGCNVVSLTIVFPLKGIGGGFLGPAQRYQCHNGKIEVTYLSQIDNELQIDLVNVGITKLTLRAN